jgi:hypothetical protein
MGIKTYDIVVSLTMEILHKMDNIFEECLKK